MSEPTHQGARELLSGLGRGEVSALEAVRSHLARIERVDPGLRAYLSVNPRAEDEARAVDRTPAARRGPLAGLPLAVKDNIATRGLATTCGSRILERFVPLADATAVQRLRREGVVILGKTNLDEFGMGSSTENSAFGPARNPWDPDRVPGGSSGGSAAAVAARMAPVALGSDTGGSVRQPAAFCGVVGLKPTYGRVSRSGLVAYGSSLDQIGILARDAADAALILECIAGADEADATCSREAPGEYVRACRPEVDGMRIGLPVEYFGQGLAPEIGRAVERAAGALRAAGARVEEVSLPHAPYTIPAYYLIATAEASSNLARFDGVRYGERAPAGRASDAADVPGTSGDLSALYASTRGAGFGEEVRRRIMLGTYALSAGYHDAFYGRAQHARTLLRRDYARVFDSGIDLLLTPTTPTPPFRLGEKIDDPLAMYLSDVYTASANLAGVPAISVPVGRTGGGLPLGAQLVAPAFAEERLFRAATVLQPLAPGDEPPLPPGSAC